MPARGVLGLPLLGLLLLGLLPNDQTAAQGPFDAETEALLVTAVTAATRLDLYNSRCRGDDSGRRIDNLNKLLVSKLRITVLTVEDDLFPERSYRKAQQGLETAFLEWLRDAGGCPGAKAEDLPAQLSRDYEDALTAIRALP